MKALSVQQPFAFEISTSMKTIEVRTWDTLHRGDLLICSSGKAAFPKEEMEDMEDDYGCLFLYGQAICVVSVADVRLMAKGDEDEALIDNMDPEAFSWILEDVRPIIPFPVKGKQGLFDVDDALIEFSPFKFDDSVLVKEGTVAELFGMDLSGWQGRVSTVLRTEEGEPRVTVMWDSVSLEQIPLSVIEQCEKEGVDWTGVLLRLRELEITEPRDTWEEVEDTLERIIEGNPAIFPE